jgi:hypothetical protein
MSSSGMWRFVDLAHAGSPFADFSPLKMEAIRSSETSADARSTQAHMIFFKMSYHFILFQQYTCINAHTKHELQSAVHTRKTSFFEI